MAGGGWVGHPARPVLEQALAPGGERLRMLPAALPQEAAEGAGVGELRVMEPAPGDLGEEPLAVLLGVTRSTQGEFGPRALDE